MEGALVQEVFLSICCVPGIVPEAEVTRAGPNEETGEMRENTWRVSERWTDRSGQQTPSAGETRGAGRDHG